MPTGTTPQPTSEQSEQPAKNICQEAAQELLKCLDLKNEHVQRVQIRRIVLAVDFKDICECKDIN